MPTSGSYCGRGSRILAAQVLCSYVAEEWEEEERDVGAAWGSTASFINNFKLLSKMVLALSLSLFVGKLFYMRSGYSAVY